MTRRIDGKAIKSVRSEANTVRAVRNPKRNTAALVARQRTLNPAVKTLAENGDLIVLIKPQFELQRDQVGRGGIVKDSQLHKEAVNKVIKS